jgi:hypothetical protein
LGTSGPENMPSLRNGAQSLSSASILSFIGLSCLVTLGLQGPLILTRAPLTSPSFFFLFFFNHTAYQSTDYGKVVAQADSLQGYPAFPLMIQG